MAQDMTQGEARAWLVVLAVYEAIQEAGKAGIPSGHLYSALMDKMDLETYQGIITILEKSNKVKNTGHLLTAVV